MYKFVTAYYSVCRISRISIIFVIYTLCVPLLHTYMYVSLILTCSLFTLERQHILATLPNRCTRICYLFDSILSVCALFSQAIVRNIDACVRVSCAFDIMACVENSYNDDNRYICATFKMLSCDLFLDCLRTNSK